MANALDTLTRDDIERALCAEPGCISDAEPASFWCKVHHYAKQLRTVMTGERCTRCRKPLKKGEWVTRGSRPMNTQHAHCELPEPQLAKTKRPTRARREHPTVD